MATTDLAKTSTVIQRWVWGCIQGELVGFIPPALIGATLVALQAPEAALIAGLTIAGIAEGAILGAFQSRVLYAYLPAVSGWPTATAAAAGLAWLAGMGGSSLVQTVGGVGLLVAVPGWIIGLLAMGVLQWLRLRAVPVTSARWIPVTSFAWLIGVTIPVVALSVLPNSWPLPIHVLVAVAAAMAMAMAMGATVGLITGNTLIQLITAVEKDRSARRIISTGTV